MTRVRARVVLLVAAAGVCIVAAAGLTVSTLAAQHATAVQNATAATPLVPAVTALAARQDVPIYADGVGTVQAYQFARARAILVHSACEPSPRASASGQVAHARTRL
jgi:hypothetical protein